METPKQRFVRLVAALADLADQEGASVRIRDYATVVSLQARAGVIVAELMSVATDLADPPTRERLAAIVKLRQATARTIQQQLDVTKEQLTALQQSLRTVAKVAPVYGRTARRSSLSVVG